MDWRHTKGANPLAFVRFLGMNVRAQLLINKFLVHLEETGDDIGLGGVLGEAISLQDGGFSASAGRLYNNNKQICLIYFVYLSL